MTPERHEQICDLLYQALELDSKERDSFLNRACASNDSLRREVDSLLSLSEDACSNFLRSANFQLTLKPGTALGEYQVESLLGSGGMGEVYAARDLRLARRVAIKVLPSYLVFDHDRLRRFKQEARAAAALNHPNILAVFQLGEHQGTPYLVSELMEGETLRDRLKRGRLPLRQATDFAEQLGRGLAAAHQKGIVHRDLKPENLFVTTDGQIKILDFGIAKLSQPNCNEESFTETGVVMGTPGYMSPEQARGQSADVRSDIFAFGAVLYEMLTGRRAFRRDTAADTMSAILNEDPPAITKIVPNLPVALQRIVQRCLDKKPEQRFQNASDVVHELETLPTDRDRTILGLLAVVLAALLILFESTRIKNLTDLTHWILHRSATASTLDALVERNLTANLPENPVTAAAISRDGKYVAYTDNLKSVHLLLADSGDVRPLSLDSSYEPLDWFPDGVHLLINRVRGRPGLWKFSTWDSSLQKLWEGPVGNSDGGPVRNASVSPDGSSIAFINGENAHEIWVMGGEGEQPHRILEFSEPDGLGNVVWSPSGRRLAYIRLRGTFAKHESVIETCDLTGHNRAVVLSEPLLLGRDGVAGISWLADSRIVYSISNKLDEYNLWSVKVNADSGGELGKPEMLTAWRNLGAPGFQSTADGKRMVALERHSEDAIYVGALASGARGFEAKRLMADSWRNAATAWTKDSKSILIQSKRNGRWTILRRAINADMPETLITGAENYRDPIPSAAGRLLYNAFASADVETDVGNWRLMSTPMEGGPRSVLMAGRYSYECASLGSAPCVVADLKDNQLVFSTLDPARGKGTEIARVVYHTGELPHWSLSPDGTQIAMADTGESKAIKILNLGDRRITSLSVQRLKWKDLTSVGWAADGKRLFAVARSESSSAVILIDPNGKLAVLHEVNPRQAWIGMPIASPDGRYLAFTKRTYMSNLVLLEKF
jgi:serine/threonine protein kinase